MGVVSAEAHHAELLSVVRPQSIATWPVAGVAVMVEGNKWHVLDDWRYLGTVTDVDAVAKVLAHPRSAFDKDIYQILYKHRSLLHPLEKMM